MGLGRGTTHVELVGDLVVGQPCGNERHDLPLPGSQGVDTGHAAGGPAAGRELGNQPSGDRRREQCVSSGDDALIATAVGFVFVAAHGYHLALGVGSIIEHAAGATLGAALFGAIGVAVGTLLRSQLAGVIGMFVWALVIESLIGGLFTTVRPYLPYTAATTMAGIKLGGAAFGPAHGLVGVAGPLPFAAATALVATTFLAVAALAARTTLRRDIT